MWFKVKNQHFYYASLVLFVLFVLIKINMNYFYSCKGKFVFDSIRNKNGIYVYENGAMHFITNQASFPKWTPDGKNILAVNFEGIVIINPITKKIERKFRVPDGQVMDCILMNDGQSILYFLKNRRGAFFDFFLIKYSLENKSIKILQKFSFKHINFNIGNLLLSSDDKFVSFSAGEYLYLLNLAQGELKYLWQSAYPIGWMPDNKKLVFFTTRDRSGNLIEYSLGRIIRIDVDDSSTEIIEYSSFINSHNIKVTKDGKYFYYARRTPNNGFELVYTKLGDRKNIREINVTHTEFVNNSKGYSKDMEPDWYF
ncbi:MAG: hypothetical protein GY817_07035 [bacterium]|nr:hypothetical protein [bacterium]